MLQRSVAETNIAHLHTLAKQACSSPNLPLKQSSIQALAGYLLDGTIDASFLHEIVGGKGRCRGSPGDWEITCFTIMEILHDNIENIEKGELVGFCRAIGSALSDMYQGMSRYCRAASDSNGREGPAKMFVVKSIKRTLGEIMKYLLLERTPLGQFLPIQKLLSQNEPPETQKQRLYFKLQICLAFISAMAEQNPRIPHMQHRSILKQFQEKVIKEIIKLLPLIANNIDTSIDMYQLEGKINEGLRISEDEGRARDAGVLELDLPLAVMEAVIHFPYVLDFRIVTYPRRSQQPDQQARQRSHEYPKSIILQLCSKPFLQSLFEISGKLLACLNAQITRVSKLSLPQPAKLLTYLHYYRIVSSYIAYLANTKLSISHTSVSLVENDEYGQDGDEVSYDQFVGDFVATIWGNVARLETQFWGLYQLSRPGLQLKQPDLTSSIVSQVGECNLHTLAQLINNLDITTLLSPTPTMQSPLLESSTSSSTTYLTLLTLLHSSTTHILNSNPNITLALLQDVKVLRRLEDESISKGTVGGLLPLFRMWKAVVEEMEDVGVRVRFEGFREETKLMDEGLGDTDKHCAAETQDKLVSIIVNLLSKLCSQGQSFYCQQTPNPGAYKISQQHQQIIQIFNFISQFLRKCSRKSLLALLTEMKMILEQVYSAMAVGERYRRERGKDDGQGQRAQNWIGNYMLMARIVLLESQRIDEIIENLGQNDRNANTLDLRISITALEIRKQLVLVLYAPTPSRSPFTNDIPIIGYAFGSIKGIVKKIKTKLQLYRQKLLEAVYSEEGAKIMDRIRLKRLKMAGLLTQENTMGEVTVMSETVTQHQQVCFEDVLPEEVLGSLEDYMAALTHILFKKYFILLKQTPLMAMKREEFSSMVQVCEQVFKIVSLACQQIKQVHIDYLCILTQYEIPSAQHSKRMHELQGYIENITFTLIISFKDSLIHQYNQAKSAVYSQQGQLEEAEGRLDTLFSMYQVLVEIGTSIMLHYDKASQIDSQTKKVNIMKLMCRCELDQAFRFLIRKQASKNMDASLVLQFSVIGLIGIFSSFTKQINSNNNPITTLASIQSFIPVTSLMSLYLGSAPTSTPGSLAPKKKLLTLLALSRTILESLSTNGSEPRTLKIKYAFIGSCLQFWNGILEYIVLLHVNQKSTQYRVLDKHEEILMEVFGVFEVLGRTEKNWDHGGLNFSLLRREHRSFDVFMERLMSIFAIVYACREYEQGQDRGPSLACYPSLHTLTNRCLHQIRLHSLPFIFEFNTRTSLSVSLNSHQALAKPFTRIFIQKLLNLNSSMEINLHGGDESEREDRRRKRGLENLGEIEECLNIVKIVFAYIRRAMLYEHNRGLQENIALFMVEMHNQKVDTKGGRTRNMNGGQSSSKKSLELALFYGLVRLGLTLVQISTDNSFCIDYICSILVELPAMLNHPAICSTSTQPYPPQIPALLHEHIGIRPPPIEFFMQMWQVCAVNEKEQYTGEKGQVMEWFVQCVLQDQQDEDRRMGVGSTIVMDDFRNF